MASKVSKKITKASGEEVAFDVSKLIASLRSAGASNDVSLGIASEIEDSLFEGVATKDIYKKAFALLRKHSRSTAARYKLKKAILELGPSGYPFEKFVSKLMEAQGYKTIVGKIVAGICVSHEIDVIAEKENKRLMIECKFHSRPERHCDVKIPLYIQSRFVDVSSAWSKEAAATSKLSYQGCIVTNTRFTSDAIQYGNCTGLKLISWNYPEHGGIKDLISRSNVHPVTCLTSISAKEKTAILEKGIVLCKELCAKPDLLTEIGIKPRRHKNILKEGLDICTFQAY